LILDSVFFTGSSLENILENFVEPELAEALSTISNQSWEPALNSVLVNKSKCPWKLSKVILGRSHLRLLFRTVVTTYESEASETFGSHDFAEAVANARVHLWISLKQL